MKGIEELKEECARKMGRGIASPSDFNELSLRIRTATGRSVSVSSIKRIWGYVSYSHRPTNETLSILAAFAGYRDWHDFRTSDAAAESSDFLRKDVVKASDLAPGMRLRLCWKPDRECEVECLGDRRFKVVGTENSKLQTGDIFCCEVMAKGEPLICHDVRRGNRYVAEGYVAGKTDGLLSVDIL